jgi:DNA polymerase III alpha subunit (gram-positive type)
MTDAAYVEMQVTTHFSFLRGASSPEELFAAAALLDLPALGIVDRGSVAGIVRAWDAERTTGVRAIVGARLDLTDGTALCVYPPTAPPTDGCAGCSASGRRGPARARAISAGRTSRSGVRA